MVPQAFEQPFSPVNLFYDQTTPIRAIWMEKNWKMPAVRVSMECMSVHHGLPCNMHEFAELYCGPAKTANWRVGNHPPALTSLEPEYDSGGRLRGVSHFVHI